MLKSLVVILCAAVAVHAAEEVLPITAADVAADVAAGADDFALPLGTITCQIDSPHRDECIKEAINDMLPRLGNGMVSLNIPPLDPLMLERTSFKHKRPNLFDVSGEVRKVRVTGGTRAVLKDVKTNITRTDIETTMELYIPSILAEGLYKTEGRFNNLRIKSKGFFNFTASDVSVTTKAVGKFEIHNGQKHLRLSRFDWIPTVGDMKVYATGILPDPELNRLVLDFINQYWPYIYREILPESRSVWEPIAVAEANKFLLHVPIKKILYFSDEV